MVVKLLRSNHLDRYQYFSFFVKRVAYGVILLVMPTMALASNKMTQHPLQLENGVQVSIEHNNSKSVTLITGDIVVAQPTTSQSTLVAIDASTKKPVPFRSIVKNGQFFIIPNSAQPLLDLGILDIELFNIAKLQQYTSTPDVSSWKILVKYKQGSAPINFGATIDTSYIEAIQTQIVTVNYSNAEHIWQLLTSNTDIKRISLDEKVIAH